MRSFVRNFAPHPEHEAAVAAAQYGNRPHSIYHTAFAPTRQTYAVNTGRYYQNTEHIAEIIEILHKPYQPTQSDPGGVIASFYDQQWESSGGGAIA